LPESLPGGSLSGEFAATCTISLLEALWAGGAPAGGDGNGGLLPGGEAAADAACWRRHVLCAIVRSKVLPEAARCLQHAAQLEAGGGGGGSMPLGVLAARRHSAPSWDPGALSSFGSAGGSWASAPRSYTATSPLLHCSGGVSPSAGRGGGLLRSQSGGLPADHGAHGSGGGGGGGPGALGRGGAGAGAALQASRSAQASPRGGAGGCGAGSGGGAGSPFDYQRSSSASPLLRLSVGALQLPGAAWRMLDLASPVSTASAPAGDRSFSAAAHAKGHALGGAASGELSSQPSFSSLPGGLGVSLSAASLTRAGESGVFSSCASLASLPSSAGGAGPAGGGGGGLCLQRLQVRLDVLLLSIAEAVAEALPPAAASASDGGSGQLAAYLLATGDAVVTLREALAAARSVAAAAAAAAAEAAPGDEGGGGAGSLLPGACSPAALPRAVASRLLHALGAAAQQLARGDTAAAGAAAWSVDAVLAALPAQLGCWNLRSCGQLGGASELHLGLHACASCGAAWYCSKACRHAAWQAHLPTCKAAAAAAAAAAAGSGGGAGL
jgi:hypothetical protein